MHVHRLIKKSPKQGTLETTSSFDGAVFRVLGDNNVTEAGDWSNHKNGCMTLRHFRPNHHVSCNSIFKTYLETFWAFVFEYKKRYHNEMHVH